VCVCVYSICSRELNTSPSSYDWENQNIIACSFDIRSPRISAFEVHERFNNIFVVQKTEIRTVQYNWVEHGCKFTLNFEIRYVRRDFDSPTPAGRVQVFQW
jgi:hypothetical protein